MTQVPITQSAIGTEITRQPSAATNVMAFARRELSEAISSRWFLLYTAAFTVLALAVSFVSLAGSGSQGMAGFSRTAAGLLNLIMLVVPLMALTAGAGSIAGERERGTLLYLLAQPVSRLEVLLGKYLGLAAALCASIGLAFGLSATVLAWRAGGVGIWDYLTLAWLTWLLALVMLAMGLTISTLSRKTGIATGVGLFVWLVLVFMSDLGLMAGTIIFRLRVQELFSIAVLNPLQAFKMAVIVRMDASLDVLGPAGLYASQTYGHWLPWMLLGVLMGWLVLLLTAATASFSRRSAV